MINICIPYYKEYDAVKPALAELPPNKYRVSAMQGTLISQSRNSLILGRYNSLMYPAPPKEDTLFIDSDISATVDDIEAICKLGETNPVVFFPYETRKGSNLYQCGEWGQAIGVTGMSYSSHSRGTHNVAWCGAGFLYIKKEVFAELDFPYFYHGVLRYMEHAVNHSEDIGFCIKLHNKGIPILCNFKNPVNHIKEMSKYEYQ